jgi:hypothetical protein
MWIIYTGLISNEISCLDTKGYNVSPEQMAKNYQYYLDEQEKADAAKKISISQEYVVTN